MSSSNNVDVKNHLSLIARLLRMKLASMKIPDDKKRTAEYLLEYLRGEPYKLDITSVDQLRKLMNEGDDSGFHGKRDNDDKWKIFIENERDEIKKSMYPKGSFGDATYKFDIESAYDLIAHADNADTIRFLNTYIDMDEWHSPIIQMHLCIQKNIEQRNNFFAIHDCHDKNGKNGKAVLACVANPPRYRHYRILFLPLTDKEYSDRLKKQESFYEGLRFSALVHLSLSIQLSVVTATQLALIVTGKEANIKNEGFKNEIKDFFQNKSNLEILGIKSELETALTQDDNFREVEQLLKESIELMRDIPNTAKEDGMDFLQILRTKKENGQKNLWFAYEHDENGLTYASVSKSDYIKVKEQFAEIIFKVITEPLRPETLNIMKLDPLYPFYEKKKHETFTNFIPKYNPLNKVGLHS
jgi:hypothetical protein